MLLWRVDHSLWLYPRLPVTVCDVALACRLWSVTLSQDVGHSLRCCVSDGLWRDPGVCRSRSVMGSRSPSVKVCDGVTESVGHGLWVGVGEFTNYHHSTLFFPAKCKTWYFFKNVSTLGILLLLGVLNIKNSSSLLFSLSFFLHYSFLPLLLRSHLFQNRNLEYPRWVKFNHDTYNSLNR